MSLRTITQSTGALWGTTARTLLDVQGRPHIPALAPESSHSFQVPFPSAMARSASMAAEEMASVGVVVI